MSLFIELSIELSHGNRLRVEYMCGDLIVGLDRVILKVCECSLKYLIVGSFSSSRGSNKHKSVSDLDSVVELKDFINECLNRLEVKFRVFAHINNSL